MPNTTLGEAAPTTTLPDALAFAQSKCPMTNNKIKGLTTTDKSEILGYGNRLRV
jgi:hypothetical protein